MAHNRFGIVVDVLVAVVCVAALTMIGLRLWGPARGPAGAFADLTGTAVSDTVNIDWSSADRTLVLSLHSECRFCTASLPFYQRLLDTRGDAPVQVVVAASAQDTAIDSYLDGGGVQPDHVVDVDEGALPVAATPALFLVDPAGVIIDAWVGQLGDEQETAVLEALFGE